MKITFDADPRDMASMAMLHNVFSTLAATTPAVAPTVEKPADKPAETKRAISERELLSLRKLPSTPAERAHLRPIPNETNERVVQYGLKELSTPIEATPAEATPVVAEAPTVEEHTVEAPQPSNKKPRKKCTTITQEMKKYIVDHYKRGRGAAENSATNIAAKLNISDKSVLNVYRDHVNTLLELDKSREETLAKGRESKQRLTTRITEAKLPPLQMDWLPT